MRSSIGPFALTLAVNAYSADSDLPGILTLPWPADESPSDALVPVGQRNALPQAGVSNPEPVGAIYPPFVGVGPATLPPASSIASDNLRWFSNWIDWLFGVAVIAIAAAVLNRRSVSQP